MATNISRRGLLIGGGAGAGLLIAWGVWPREYAANLTAGPGDHLFGAWLKIAEDGRVTVAVPQVEHGQGVYTALPQIVADELGADWRTVGVEAAPINPLYANPLGVTEMFDGALGRVPAPVLGGWATRATLMLTGGSSSVRQFEEDARTAGATARVLLCKAAAARWDVDWTACRVEAGFVRQGARRLRFAELASAAAGETPPDPLPIGQAGAGKLMGQNLPRLDAPAKVDGSANFAADIRLADMVHARIRQGPIGDTRLMSVDRAAADRVRGMVSVVEAPGWVAAVGTTSWSAEQGLDALAPRFATSGHLVDDASIARSLADALTAEGTRIAGAGDPAPLLGGGGVIEARYQVMPGVHAAIETPAATATYRDGRLELWIQTQAPAAARALAASAAGLSEAAVVVHPMMIGGSFGQALDHRVVEQAAVLAMRLKRPVSLTWSRGESLLHDLYRPPALARMRARLAANGAVAAWHAAIAAPDMSRALADRLLPQAFAAAELAGRGGDRMAAAGATPPYRLPACVIDHHGADCDLPTGYLRGGAHGYTAFFTESFMDELAAVTGTEPVSFRIAMLGGDPRLARCLSTVAALGGWEGGAAGSGQGIACHRFRGSAVAVLAEAHVEGGRPVVDRLVLAADCGRVVNPDLVRQQLEGGLIFGLAHAMGATTGFAGGLAQVRGFDTLRLPRLRDTPDLTVELIRSDEPPGGVSELAVPPVAPAIANALHAATGNRFRSLPFGQGT
ncbi:isoquinoline 1-oxidoreductase, beta subunit [Sphingomonas gellani]|uniref:Isoquinoline 1-oxidoreductase, beta subunit n=2 Tax=Sphingomonas gellani TaxID=1166340 RepID=A0A1H8C5C4_9SPHN|nr:isoquinoline 1-oxidoreductase, beta subunit [Sphingomonas gellani]